MNVSKIKLFKPLKAAEYNIQHNLNGNVELIVVNESNEKVTGQMQILSPDVLWLKPDTDDYKQLTIQIKIKS